MTFSSVASSGWIAASRDVIRVAAVIGREFPRRVLERVVPDTPQTLDERLRTLRSADLVRIARAWPDVIYTFKHALTHEVAYDVARRSGAAIATCPHRRSRGAGYTPTACRSMSACSLIISLTSGAMGQGRRVPACRGRSGRARLRSP